MNKVLAGALLGVIVLVPTLAESHGMRGGPEGADLKAEMIERFKDADTNGDGMLTRAEIYQFRGARAADIDRDDDGTISVEELDDSRKAFRLKRQQRFITHLDTDGDGTVTTDEYARAGSKMLRRIDADRDGVITLEEVTEMRGPRSGKGHPKSRYGHCRGPE